ncbi:MAG: M23 family metallopeptidase [Bacillales bacterium]|jgi:murein DD-endopeptidase MepM/ murein hydrolase activator NlpD|nr:M23 family metallopeptidase [Bacillales bacterium]MCI7559064.1 M23 family metallopeptidase [Clostridium sp.]
MKKYSKIIIPSIYVGVIGVMVVSCLLVVSGVKNFLNERKDYDYTLDKVFIKDTIPVSKNENNMIIKPYTNDKVKVYSYFYDFEGDTKKQLDSLIYYENTYMQNNGVDYSNDEEFDVVSILDGEVISIEDNAIYGKVVTIKHNDNLKSVYSNVKNVLVNVGYKISQGEIFASSDTYKVDTKVKSLLHFEVYYKDNAIDPENLYTMSVSDLK